MKVALCLLAVVAVGLARPQNYVQEDFNKVYQTALQRGFVRPDETLLTGPVPVPLVNQLENVPFDQPVAINQFVQLVPNAPEVFPPLQRSVDDALVRARNTPLTPQERVF
uniref:Uncharacterized protein n=1 Tax=Anopheles coluzzii TaxID=1518534 RepID=A0A6E8WAG0_ANOCL|nr:uncharacterized protein LOC120957279 [Anopheles coluzzii]XP_049464486.1 uncharacterized protein LOC120957279 [Anopheles coluzzii]